ncbi:MAG: methyl-accepting chemotaxis protein [Rhodospirillales bacterium]|nr:methyl-accepting chemotaxis protein [Rhodospirillales bacterium]MCB9995860.1 methyl-accepting chemotaxis protein [Rhodospirillales bacterium]
MTNLFSLSNMSSISKARKLAVFAGAGVVIGAGSLFVGGTVFAVIGIAALLAALVSLWKATQFLAFAESEISRMNTACKALARGDFETRISNITEEGDFGEFQWAVNEMTDYMDAFVREATAAMEYVSRNQYFRRILEDGMHGALLNGARVINSATESVEEKMNGFVSIADDFDASLKDVVMNINQTVSSLEGTAKTMAVTVSSTREGTESAVNKSDETSLNVQTISAAAEEMSSSIAEISQQVTKTSQVAGRAVEESEKARQTMEQMTEMAARIGEVSQMIEEIAEQTNLLALNATIEAARAGDAGKGFAVVASEVKDLATQTAEATEEISRNIGDIQRVTEQAVQAFAGIGETIEEINAAATVVAAAIEEQSAASQEIASNAEKASAGTMGMASNVKDVSASINQVDEASGQVMQVTSQLSEHVTVKVEDLMGKMGVFMTELKKIA